MIRSSIVAFLVVMTTLIPSTASGQQSIQPIDGSTGLFGVKGVSVPPIKRTEIRTLVDLGTIDTDGHERIILNLAGQMLGEDGTGAPVGVILIPDIAPFDQAFSGLGLLPASLEITVAVNSRSAAYFMAQQQKFDIGFPRYRALAYNNSNSPVTISFFAYRTR